MAKDTRLQKMLADCGVASRRKAEAMIASGRVAVNGVRAAIGDKVDVKKDRVTVDGELVRPVEEKLYIMVYKPRGYLTAMSDDRGRKCVSELVEELGTRVYPVGRLDKDSEGLLLMTNDGEFANLIAHPSTHVPKVYRVTVRPGVTEAQLTRLAVGVEIDGRMTAPASVRVLEQQPGRVVLEFVLHEGRNRQIRNMCEAVGLEVARLKRTAIGAVKLGMLPQGRFRELTPDEVRRLRTAAKKKGAKAEGKGEERMLQIVPMEERDREAAVLRETPGADAEARVLVMTDGADELGLVVCRRARKDARRLRLFGGGPDGFHRRKAGCRRPFLSSIRSCAPPRHSARSTARTGSGRTFPDFYGLLPPARGSRRPRSHMEAPMSAIVHYT